MPILPSEDEAVLQETSGQPSVDPGKPGEASSPTPAAEKRALKCIFCGSTQVRLSKKQRNSQSQLIYRCQTCKKHFKVGVPRFPTRHIAAGAFVALILVGLVVSPLLRNSAEVDNQPELFQLEGAELEAAQAAAKRGDPQAQYSLGRNYWNQNAYPQAMAWIKAAAGQRHPDAEYLLAMAYLEGHGTTQNYRSALEQFTLAAQHGHTEAQFQLGMLYKDGTGIPRNYETAYIWLNVAAARGHAEASIQRDKITRLIPVEEISRAQQASTEMLARFSGVQAVKGQGKGL